MASQVERDSELQHSFGPLEVGFDFLPLELPAAAPGSVPTVPHDKLPVLDLASDEPLVLPEEGVAKGSRAADGVIRGLTPPARQKKKSPRVAGAIWLDGDVIMCACPDCQAPLSIRLWLMAADCWRCGTTIELTDEQEREVQRLLEGRAPAKSAQPLPYVEKMPVIEPAAPTPAVTPAPPTPPRQRFRGAPEAPVLPGESIRGLTPPARLPSHPSPVTSSPRSTPSARPGQTTRRRARRQEPWWHRLFKDMPAWLISLLVHLILITLTAMFTRPVEETEGPFITLSMMSVRNPNGGGDVGPLENDLLAKFDLPLPNKSDLKDDKQREALLAANQDARELRLDDDAPPPQLPELETVKQRVGRADVAGRMAARDPRLRVEMVTKEGGTTLTEAAVARGLRWLANHQNADGSWSLSGFRHAGDCSCNGDGAYRNKSPGTALAMLPFLGAGQTHLVGRYRGAVARGLRWMLENQKENGDLRAGANDNSGMYTHGQATIVLCEAFAMTGDEQLRIPAQKAVDFIVQAQYLDGGWRYQPTPRSQAGDTSVVGWQLMALQSARAANLTVPEATLSLADQYLDSCSHRDGALYSYQARGGPTPVMTAEGLLCRMYLGWKKDNASLRGGVEYLASDHLPSRSKPNIYFWYYGTQTMHHYGGPEWEEWNLRMRDILVQTQETGGHAAGSWAPRGDHASAGGRIYMTALAICTLEVYYRHLPIYRQIELE